MRLKLTKDAILAELPATREQLEAECLTDRHRRRLDAVLSNLVRRDLVERPVRNGSVVYERKVVASTVEAA